MPAGTGNPIQFACQATLTDSERDFSGVQQRKVPPASVLLALDSLTWLPYRNHGTSNAGYALQKNFSHFSIPVREMFLEVSLGRRYEQGIMCKGAFNG